MMWEMRSSVIFMGALLARCGVARLSLPGGCQLGKRPIDIHLAALRQMGAQIEENGGEISCSADKLRGTELRLPFPSVGATENIMLAATAAEGVTVIHGAAREPEISALASYLRLLGSRITGDGTDTVTVEGPICEASAEYRIIPDRIVASTLACAAAATGGEGLRLSLDLLSGWTEAETAAWLRARRRAGLSETAQLLTGTLHTRLGQTVCRAAGFTNQPPETLTDGDLDRIARSLRGFSLPVKVSYMIFEAIALPPRYSCLSLSVHGYSETLRLPRSRRMTLPM